MTVMTAEEAQDLPEAASPTQDDPSIINRIVVLLTPLFALLAASVAAWVGKHIPGVKLDATQNLPATDDQTVLVLKAPADVP